MLLRNAEVADLPALMDKLGWRATDRLTRTSFPPHPVLVDYELDL